MINRQLDDILSHRASNEEENYALIAEPTSCSTGCGCGAFKADHLKYAFPIANAIVSAAGTALELKSEPRAVLLISIIGNFLSEASINSIYTIESIDSAYDIIKNRSLPKLDLSTREEIVAAISSIIMGTCAVAFESILAYDFVFQLPKKYAFTQSINITGWKALSGITACFVGGGNLATQGYATYEAVRNTLAVDGTKPKYANAVSKFVSPTAGFAVSVIGSCSEALLRCTGMYDALNITSLPTKLTVAGLGTITCFTSFSMDGKFNMECLDSFFGSFTPKAGTFPGYKNPKNVFALIMALGAGAMLAYAYHGLTKDALISFLDALGIDLADAATPIIQAFACTGATSNFINTTGSLYPIIRKAEDKLGNILNTIYNKVASCYPFQTKSNATELINSFSLTSSNYEPPRFISKEIPIINPDVDNVFDEQFDEQFPEATLIDLDSLPSSDDESLELVGGLSPRLGHSAFTLFSFSEEEDDTPELLGGPPSATRYSFNGN